MAQDKNVAQRPEVCRPHNTPDHVWKLKTVQELCFIMMSYCWSRGAVPSLPYIRPDHLSSEYSGRSCACIPAGLEAEL